MPSTRVAFQMSWIDPAQAGQEDRHHQPRRLPDRGDHQRVDDHLPVHEPVEGEALKAGVVHQLLEPEARIEEPLPDQAGDDERHRVGIQKNRAEQALGADLLVDEDREQEAEHEAAREEQHAEHGDVLGRDQETGVGQQAPVLVEADEVEGRQELGAREREPDRPDHAAEIDHDDHDRRGQQGQPRRQARGQRAPAARRQPDRDRHGAGPEEPAGGHRRPPAWRSQPAVSTAEA